MINFLAGILFLLVIIVSLLAVGWLYELLLYGLGLYREFGYGGRTPFDEPTEAAINGTLNLITLVLKSAFVIVVSIIVYYGLYYLGQGFFNLISSF